MTKYSDDLSALVSKAADQEPLLHEIRLELVDAQARIEQEGEALRQEMARRVARLNETIAAYNATAAGYNRLITDLTKGIARLARSQPRGWSSGDAAQALLDWQSALVEGKIETIDPVGPPDLDLPDIVVPDELPPLRPEAG